MVWAEDLLDRPGVGPKNIPIVFISQFKTLTVTAGPAAFLEVLD